ncbi:MAG: PDZ domain-containing protein [Bacteroidaceae bacterium]|nr:PDZ domain-containing protein [Bacteroidaceae bacterium]
MLTLGFVACADSDEPLKPVESPEDPEEEQVSPFQDEKAYANFFAYNAMNDVYLWNQDITDAFKTWTILGDPIEAVKNARYKEDGKDVDRWTQMTDSYTEMVNGTNGVSTGTYGWGLQGVNYVNYNTICAYVTYTYPGSPAEEAGLKRGDMILHINGKNITNETYYDLYYSNSIELGLGTFKDGAFALTGKTIKMDAIDMEEDPILVTKVFDCGGKKVGYLHYTSFTFQSSVGLHDVCKQFKAEGISEFILDLRYNGGGYVFTEEVLASMLAPESEVKNKSVYETEVYNDSYMEYYKQKGIDFNTYFGTVFKQTFQSKTYNINTSDANLGLDKIYVLVGDGSASASESIIVGLLPYMNIEIIGEQTHGKYCTGIMWKGEDWFQDIVDSYKQNKMDFAEKYPRFADWKKYIADWGLYVMISRYADKNGNNPCMPDGLKPDIEVEDRYMETYPLGDEREALLHIALQRAGKTDLEPRPESRSAMELSSGELLPGKNNPLDGKRIYTGKLIPKAVQF